MPPGEKICMIKVSDLVSRAPLHWRHYDHGGVSNHQHHGCLLDRLFRRRSKKTSKLRVTGHCVGNSPVPVNSPHKGPVTRKMFPFDDVVWEEHSFTPMDQSPYLGRLSTQTSLHCVIDDRLESVNDGAITGACCLIFLNVLIPSITQFCWKKMEIYFITSAELKCFSCYFRWRKQVVKFHQETSVLWHCF